ncbi:MAG: YciI family protein [Pseudomonadota bacterium]
MLFAVTCTDQDGALQMRLDNRQAHLAWANADGTAVRMGGPLLNPEGQPVGSLLIVEAGDEAQLRDILTEDPYAKAGLFKDVFWIPFKWTLHAPEDLSA